MEPIEKAIQQLTSLVIRYQSLKLLFNQFQKHIEEANKQTFPVRGILVNTLSATKSGVTFLDHLYVVSFSVQNSRGVIVFTSVGDGHTNTEVTQVGSVSFNGQGVVDIKQPPNEDQMDINNDSCSLNLLLNWLHQGTHA